MLQELGVPGGVQLVAVAPEENEFRHQGHREGRVDVRQAQNVHDIVAWLPVFGNALGFRAVANAGRVFRPLQADVLDEARVQFFGRAAALTPVQNELRDGILDKLAINP